MYLPHTTNFYPIFPSLPSVHTLTAYRLTFTIYLLLLPSHYRLLALLFPPVYRCLHLTSFTSTTTIAICIITHCRPPSPPTTRQHPPSPPTTSWRSALCSALGVGCCGVESIFQERRISSISNQ